ncbi:MAG: hypothetical protein ACK58L_19990 [Planctomycetota bacterium]
MSETHPKNAQAVLSNDDLLLHASAVLDGETYGDMPELSGRASREALALADQFQQDAMIVSALLRKIPVQTLSSPLIHSRDLQGLDRESSRVRISVGHGPGERPSRQKFAGVVSILTMTGCLLIGLFAPHTDESALPRITASWKVRKAAASAVTDFPSEDHWNVVVVRMDHRDRIAAMQAVQRVVREHGFDFARSAGKEMPDWLGVVLSADADESRALLEDLRNTVPMESVEQDPTRIAESTREELIAAVQESLRYPTMSELHYGKVYLAMPESDRQTSMEVSRVAAADIDLPTTHLSGTESQARTSSAIEASAGAPATATEDLSRRQDGVTLVVFQFDQLPAADLKI